MNVHFLIALTTVLFFETKQSQSAITSIDTTPAHLNKIYPVAEPTGASVKVKWTWQLPATVRKAFNKSQYSNWYIEKITSCNFAGKTIYRFCINNGNLLDGDHYDSFLKPGSLDISGDGIIILR